MNVIIRSLFRVPLAVTFIAFSWEAYAEISEKDCLAGSPRSVYEIACTKKLKRTDLTNKQRATAYYLRGFSRLYARQNKIAGEDFDKGLALNPDNNLLHRQRGFVYLRQYRMEKALLHAKRAAELYPQGQEEHALLGQIYMRAGQTRLAIESFSKAIEIKSDHYSSRYTRAELLMNSGKYKQALADLLVLMKADEAVLKRIGNASIYDRNTGYYQATRVKLAMTLQELGRYAEAEKVMNTIVKSHPSGPILVAQGILYRFMPVGQNLPDRRSEAIASLKQALKLEPQYSKAWRLLANTMRGTKQKQEALEANETGFRTNRVLRFIPSILWERGLILRAMGKTEKAVEFGVAAIEEATKMGPSIVASFYTSLRNRGYWQSDKFPRKLNQDVIDATTACFHDPACL